SIIELRNKGMHEREQNEDYMKIMMTIANNLDMFANSIDKLKKYIERVENESFIWNEIRNGKRISVSSQTLTDTSTNGKQKSKRFSRRMQGAIYGAMNALRDIPVALGNIAPIAPENTLDELSENSETQLNDESEIEIELEEEEPLEAALERIKILKKRFSDMLQMV
ncbi:unnamed protein product, partial [Litomosoides sigmodontis]